MGDPNKEKKAPIIEFKGEGGKSLSTKEKESFKKYLENKENQEKKEIIVITQQELDEFKKLLNETPRDETKLKEFVQRQEAETIISSEILEGTQLVENFGGIEKLTQFTEMLKKASYEHFFGSKGILGKLPLSEDAKHNFSVGANFFLIDLLLKEIEKNGDTKSIQDSVEKLFGKEKGSLNKVIETGGKAKSIIDFITLAFESFNENESLRGIVSKVYEGEKDGKLQEILKGLNLNIENSEKQAIFMNPLKTKEFLDLVYGGAGKEEINKYLEENNKPKNIKFSENDKKNLQAVGEKLTKSLGEKTIGTISKINDFVDKIGEFKDNIKASIEGNTELIGLLKFVAAVPILGDLLKQFLGFIGIDDIEKLNSGEDFETSKKNISEKIIAKGSIFEGKKLGDDFMKKENGEDDTDFLKDVKFLSGNKNGDDFGKFIGELFSKEGEYKVFIENKSIKTDILKGEELNYKELKRTISLFKEYKIAKEADKSLTVENFIEKKNKQEEENEARLEEAIANTQTSVAAIRSLGEQTEQTSDKTKAPQEITQQNKELFIEGSENLEIKNGRIEGIFEVHGKKYKLEIFNVKGKGNLIITGNGEQRVYSCDNKKFIEKIIGFGNLEQTAIRSHFDEKIKKGSTEDVKLNGYSLKEILMNGLHEKVPKTGPLSFLGENVDMKGLKEQFEENFFTFISPSNKYKLKTETVSINFGKKMYNFEPNVG